MRLEDRWKSQQRKVIKEREGYTRDEYIKEDLPLARVLAAGAIAAAGIGLYKTGGLKKLISQTIDYSSKYKAITPTAVKSFDNWARDVGKDAPIDSLMRSKSVKSMVKKAYKEGYSKRHWDATIKDFKDLRRKVRNDVDKTVKAHKSGKLRNVGKTQLTSGVDEIGFATWKIGNIKARRKAENIMRADLVKEMTVAKKQQDLSLKRTGYRAATFEDLFVASRNSKGKVTLGRKAEFDIDDNLQRRLEEFVQYTKIDNEDGIAETLFDSGKFKNLKIDDNILINEKGKIADLRDAVESRNKFINVLSTEFKIPFVGINPLKLFGGDTLGIKRDRFDVLSRESVQSGLTNQIGRQKLKDSKGFEDTYTIASNGNIYNYNHQKEKFDLIARDKVLMKIRKTKSGIPKQLNDFAKMSYLNKKDFVSYDKSDGMFNYFKSKAANFLDVGKQQGMESDFEGLFDAINPNKALEKISSKTIDKAKLYKTTKTNFVELSESFGTTEAVSDMNDKANHYVNIVLNRRYTLKDVIDPKSQIDIADYFKQYLYGRGNLDKVNAGSLGFYNLIERMNQAFNPFGLALSQDSTGTAIQTAKNIILKRFMPVYLGYQGIEYINYLTEDSETGDNIEKQVARTTASTDLAIREVGDFLGVSKVAKKIKELTPGSDHLEELPFIKNLNLDKTAEEQAEWYREGYDPIRKGRYWDLGNTAFTGGKVTHFEPNWYRKTLADAEFSREKYGSRKEYFENHWLPTPTNPLAPIKHFITDKYHYDVKHYYDRPYLMTSPEFEHVPIIGPMLSGTVGKVVKPQRKMHLEYWDGTAGKDVAKTYWEGNSMEVNYGQGNGNLIASSPEMNAISFNYETSPAEPNRRVYTTGSGATSVVDIGNYDDDFVNEQLTTRGLKGIPYVDTRVSPMEGAGSVQVGTGGESSDGSVYLEGEGNGEVQLNNSGGYMQGSGGNQLVSAANPNALSSSFANQIMDTANVTGIYGYGATTYVTGDVGSGKQVIDTMGYSMSFNKQIWDKNLGGFGGDFSEIFRRLVQKRRNDVEYINPIRNQMSDWLPGDEYFTDFKSGDPFSKLQNGELRLPGEAYQRLWGKNIYDMELDVTQAIGTSDSIYKEILHQGDIDMKLTPEIKDEKARMAIKNNMLRTWGSQGFAEGTGGTIESDTLKMKASYDALLDKSNVFGEESLANIKVVNSDVYNSVMEGGLPVNDLLEMNTTLGLAGKSTGYVKYVNAGQEEDYGLWQKFKDSYDIVANGRGGFLNKAGRVMDIAKADTLPTLENKDYKIKFDKELFNMTISNVDTARSQVVNDIQNRTIKEGDLYSHMDRLRILADIAPYSDNYRDTLAMVSANATEDEKEEIETIKDRVTMQKEPLRITPYKFKTANVDTLRTEITRVDGKSIYVDFNGEERKLNFAGVTGIIDPNSKQMQDKEASIKKNLVEGNKVVLKVDADTLVRDRTKGLKAIVIDDSGTNINKELLDQGVVGEKEDDNSAVAINARFNGLERLIGSTWERFAHMDNIFNNKFLQVRSAKEEYERDQVYGEKK